MSESDPNAKFEQRTKALFDESVDGLNGNLRSRLTQARHQALTEAGSSRISRRVWIPAAGLTTVAAITAFVVVPRIQSEHRETEAFASADDMAILLNNDDLDRLLNAELLFQFIHNLRDSLDRPIRFCRGGCAGRD